MKLSMWSSYYWGLSPEDTILELEKYGYHYTELSDEHGAMLLERGDPEKIGAAYGAFAREHGVSIEQGHLWLKVPLCAPEERGVVDILKGWLDLFHAAGVTASVLHCDSHSFPEGTGWEEKADKNAEILRRLCKHIEGTDMTICLENLYTPAGVVPVVATVDELLAVIDRAGNHPNLGICLDTGHLNIVKGQDQAEFIRKAGDKLKALHLADNEGERDQHMIPFGRGNVDFVKIMKALREIGYDRLYNLEVPGERTAPLPVLGYKLEYLKKMFAYLETAE